MDSEASGLMKKISDYILATSFKIVAFCAVALFINLLLVTLASHYVQLSTEASKYEKWLVSGVPQQCEAVKSQCRQASYEPVQPKIDYDACVYKELGKLNCNVFPPEKFSTDFYLGDILAGFIQIFLSVVGGFYSLKFYCSIKHVGWQRITIVSATLASAAFTYAFKESVLSYRSSSFEVFVMFLIAFLACIAMPYLAAHFYKWMSKGFTSEEETASFIRTTFVAGNEVVQNQITKKFLLTALKISGVFSGVIFMLMVKPEKTLQSFATGLIASIIIVLVLYALKKYKAKE